MKKMPMTLVDLQIALGKTLLAVLDEEQTKEERAVAITTAGAVYAGARDLIHNASTIMRAKEIIAEGKIKDVDSIKALVGDIK